MTVPVDTIGGTVFRGRNISVDSRLPLLQDLWQQQQLTDILLRSSDGQEFPCHQVVLAASSGFFRALLATTGPHMNDCKHDSSQSSLATFDLPSVDGPTLLSVLKTLYTGQLLVPEAGKIEPLLQVGSFLEVEVIRNACCEVGNPCYCCLCCSECFTAAAPLRLARTLCAYKAI